ncbi:tetratricopeptide repeat protein [Ilumatobacter sp.]|uniref:tetratricopeptide repeat protein n=1 Tax=Ilumatobacter sp. TaxID=1967498 RepID=UPI003C51C1AD
MAAWDLAWGEFLHFHGDPIATLAPHVDADESFVMGSVFIAAYSVLGGMSLDAPHVRAAIDRAGDVAATDAELGHLRALELMVAGDFTEAAGAWDRVARASRDFAAVRIAHDLYLHVGDDVGRLESSGRAVAEWTPDIAGAHFVMGQYAFALEEAGRYAEAERVGRDALDIDPDDLWARHALAHVYESTDDQAAALDLLESSLVRWSAQDALAVHIWWHLALRYLAADDPGRALEVVDRIVPDATSAFRLCDVTSLLWRLELSGTAVGNRWDVVADRWSATAERHACAFLDTHAVMAFARRPDHPGATVWFDGVERAGAAGASENDEIFRDVVGPLVDALRRFGRGDRRGAADRIDALGDHRLRRIGGSIAQRDIITLTRHSAGDLP